MEPNFTQMELKLLNEKLELLNTKMDLIFKLLENKEIKIKNEFVKKEELNWSIQDYKNCVLVQFPFNLEFKEYIKELGGKFNNTKKSMDIS